MNKNFMRPAVKLMGRLNYTQKFLLIFVLFLIPMGVISLFLLKNLTQATQITHSEKAGIAYLQVLNDVQNEVEKRRGIQVAILYGAPPPYRIQLANKTAELETIFAALAEQDRQSRGQLALGDRGMALIKSWARIKETTFTSPDVAFATHNQLLTDTRHLIRYISLSSQQVLDPEIGTYLLGKILFERVPVLATHLADMLRFSCEVAIRDDFPVTQRGKILEYRTQVMTSRDVVLSNLDALEFELNAAYQADAHIRTQLAQRGSDSVAALRHYIQYIDRELLAQSLSSADTPSAEETIALRRVPLLSASPRADAFFGEGTKAVAKIWGLGKTINPLLSNMFVARLTQQQMQEWLAYSLIGLLFVVTAYLFMGFYVSVNQMVTRIANGASALARGALDTRIDVAVKDEMASIAASFNTMASALATRAQRDEQEKQREAHKIAALNARIEKLRIHIEHVTAGDLDRRMEVWGEDDLANLARHLNTMTANLAELDMGTHQAVQRIHSGVVELQQSIGVQLAAASEQSAVVNETSIALEQIKGMTAEVMARITVLNETAERGRHESELGNVAVEQAATGMMGILQRMEGIAQTILALSEQTQQIGEITNVVNNLAQQSKMLALNASIEAAKAGDVGKGFAVVAAEVSVLAEQSQQSTAQVQKILEDIRHATDRAVIATEEGSKGVDAGMMSVQQSSEVIRQLNEVVRETASLSRQIAAVVKQEFVGLEQVAKAMKDINHVTTQFVISAQQSHVSSTDIGKVANQLRDNVRVYTPSPLTNGNDESWH